MSLKILYIEDEPDIRSIALLAMQSIGGFTVCECASGPEALEKAPDFHPDVIVIDVMMPGMSGPETYRALRQLPGLQQTPVIFMTAKVQPAEQQDYLALGAVGVIAKPFDPMRLSADIAALVGTALAGRGNQPSQG